MELQVHTTNEAIEPVSNILNEHGANGVLIEEPLDLTQKNPGVFGEIYELNPDNFPKDGIYIKAYFPENDQLTQITKQIQEEINKLKHFNIDLGHQTMTLTSVNEEDWSTSWKKYYKPTKISDTITIVPSWEDYNPKNEYEKIIKLDPGMAFGTGTHPTTKLSILALEKYIKTDDTVIDVGCGSGVLSIASLLLGAKHAYAFDLDKVAVSSTQFNSELNHLTKKITVKENNLLAHVDQDAQIIVSNILAEILVDLIAEARDRLLKDGLLILSGIIETKQTLIREKLEANGFNIVDLNQMDNWISFVAQKLD